MIKNITLGIAEDQQLFRKGIITLLNSFEGMNVILEAGNGRELLNKLQDKKPDLLILDLKMPDLDGIETTKLLRKEFPEIKIIILTIYNEERYILHLIECGAHAYLFKDAEPEELEKAIRSVIAEGFYFNLKILQVLQSNSKKKKRTISIDHIETDLSEREKEILQLICKEYTGEEIGELLFISPRTVEGHRNRLLEKTGCKNTAGLVVYAIKNNLMEMAF